MFIDNIIICTSQLLQNWFVVFIVKILDFVDCGLHIYSNIL